MKNNICISRFICNFNIDPRVKFLATVALILSTLLTGRVAICLVLGGLFAGGLVLSGTPLRTYLRNLLLLSWLLLFTFLITLWDARVANAHGLPGLGITPQGLTQALLAVGRLGLVVGWGTLLGAHSSPLEMIYGLERLLWPLRRWGIPVQTLSLITMLSLRFIPIFFEEGQHLLRAYRARGLELNQGPVMVRVKHVLFLCGPLFTSLLRRVEHLTAAMESRGFRVGGERTSLHELRFTPRDYLILGGSMLLLLGTQLWQ